MSYSFLSSQIKSKLCSPSSVVNNTEIDKTWEKINQILCTHVLRRDVIRTQNSEAEKPSADKIGRWRDINLLKLP
jgi:hypothetical protein